MEWEREEWIREYLAGESIAEIARRHNISRKAVHKWIARYDEYGAEGLRDLSRAPEHNHGVEPIWQARVTAARGQHPLWGAPKLHLILADRYGEEEAPSVSTIGRILKQEGLTRQRRQRRRAHGAGTLSAAEKANEVWCIDFKGWRRTGDGKRCEPLTVTDQWSRYLLCCQALESIRSELVQPVLERVFRDYGLPKRMRSDNGPPFGDSGPCGLTGLAVWWIELGIECERIDPGRPQQNGRHERMHRTLEEAVFCPPASTLRKQQQRFDAFRDEYNHERPHQALEQQVPASRYAPSARAYPQTIPEADYPQLWPRRRVSDRGRVSWLGETPFVSHALSGKTVAFEPAGEGLWRVWFHRHWLGLLDEREKRFLRPHMREADEYRPGGETPR